MSTFAFVCRRASPAGEVHLARQIEALIAAGHQVDLFAPNVPGLESRLAGPRVTFHSLGPGILAQVSGGGAFWLWMHAFVLLTIAQVRRHYHAIQICDSTGFFVFAAWLAHLFGARVVLDTTTIGPEELMVRTGAGRYSLRVRAAVVFEQYLVDFVDHIIAATETQRTRLMSRGCSPDKVSVIYRPPDERRFSGPLRVERHPDIAGRFLVVCHGEPGHIDDFATVIRAAGLLRERLPQALFWIVCAPDERSALDALIRELDVTRSVLIQDAMAPDHVPAFIAQADAYVVAVPRDAMTDLQLPAGVLEGLSLLVPTLAVRTQATQYYFDPQSLLAYDDVDAGDLANRLDWLARHDQARDVLAQHAREITAQVNWSRERHRYVALMSAIAALDQRPERAPAEAAGFSRLARRKGTPIRAFTAAVNAMTPPIDPALSSSDIAGMQTAQAIPLRLTTPSNQWRAGRQLRMRLGAWTLRGVATLLLFGIPIVASNTALWAKIVTALMFALVVGVMLLLPPGEAAIIVALYFVAQRSIFIHFPPEGLLGRVIVYLGTALQLIIFIGFCVRAIVQQRPLQRTFFVLWPATLFGVVSVISAWINHVPPGVALLGIEHSLHNLVFVILIAEDLPTVQQLRRYVGFIIAALCALAAVSVVETAGAFHWLGLTLPKGVLVPRAVPVSVILPDADTYAYLLNFGILLAIGMMISLNSTRVDMDSSATLTRLYNIALGAGLALLTLGEFLTSSTENWLGLLLGTLAVAIIVRGHWRYLAVGYFALILLLSFVAVPAGPGQPPTSLWTDTMALAHGELPHNAPLHKTLRVIDAQPLLGVGPGRYGGTVAYLTKSKVSTKAGLPKTTTSINLFWLHIMAETGAIGLAIYLWLMFQSERAIWRSYRRGAYGQWNAISAAIFGIVVAMSVATFFGNALEIDSLSAPFWALVGIAVALPIANRPVVTGSLPAVRFRAGTDEDDETSASTNGATLIRPREGVGGRP